jgi:hypothetical protein
MRAGLAGRPRAKSIRYQPLVRLDLALMRQLGFGRLGIRTRVRMETEFLVLVIAGLDSGIASTDGGRGDPGSGPGMTRIGRCTNGREHPRFGWQHGYRIRPGHGWSSGGRPGIGLPIENHTRMMPCPFGMACDGSKPLARVSDGKIGVKPNEIDAVPRSDSKLSLVKSQTPSQIRRKQKRTPRQ